MPGSRKLNDRSRNLNQSKRHTHTHRFGTNPSLATLGLQRTVNTVSQHPCLSQFTLHTPCIIIRMKHKYLSSTHTALLTSSHSLYIFRFISCYPPYISCSFSPFPDIVYTYKCTYMVTTQRLFNVFTHLSFTTQNSFSIL